MQHMKFKAKIPVSNLSLKAYIGFGTNRTARSTFAFVDFCVALASFRVVNAALRRFASRNRIILRLKVLRIFINFAGNHAPNTRQTLLPAMYSSPRWTRRSNRAGHIS